MKLEKYFCVLTFLFYQTTKNTLKNKHLKTSNFLKVKVELNLFWNLSWILDFLHILFKRELNYLKIISNWNILMIV